MSRLLTLHDPAVARKYYEDGAWRADTFYTLLQRHAAAAPRRPALRDGRRRLTYAELLRAVDGVAAELYEAGVRSGQRVSVCLPNGIEPVIVLLACSRNGYVCNPSLHQNYTVAEVVQILARLQSAALFAQPGYGADAAQHDIFSATTALPSLRGVFCVERAPAGAPRAGERPGFPQPREPAKGANPPDVNPDKVMYLALTSGTTGEPKGVMHSDNTLLANGRAMVKDWGHTAESVLYSHSPLSHHIATVAIAQTMVAGMELVVNDLPPGMQPLDWIEATGATYVMGVPTHAIDLLADLRRRGLKRLGRVSVFYMAGATIPRETAQAFLDLGITPQNVYGMTENGSHQYTLPHDDADTIVSTCGRACPGYETTIWNAENPDEPAPTGTVGEIGTRGALLTLGYFDNQAATESAFNRHGWFMSGDLGYLDGKGCLHVVGRKKDLIIRGGHNIHPARIESLAIRHPGVEKAAAFPVADARLGEKVCLAIVAAQGTQVEPARLLETLAREGLSRYDMPEYFIALASFPLTASGKVLKRELAAWAKSGKLQPEPVRWAEPSPRGGPRTREGR
ncbi:MAG: acyl--CoA ligase [Candidatus Lambdaproteobacteria bacterium]|nr:acyl--CoA ligase [Candidatus Lambdaproteobacteria bacterium]